MVDREVRWREGALQGPPRNRIATREWGDFTNCEKHPLIADPGLAHGSTISLSPEDGPRRYGKTKLAASAKSLKLGRSHQGWWLG